MSQIRKTKQVVRVISPEEAEALKRNGVWDGKSQSRFFRFLVNDLAWIKAPKPNGKSKRPKRRPKKNR